MRNPLSKIPFLFFLLSLIVGILFQYYFKNEYISIVFFLSGTMAMLLSYLVPKDRRFSLRWLFGLGVVLSTVGMGAFSTAYRQHLSEYTFSGTKNLYRGIVTDSPQEKAKTCLLYTSRCV